MTPNKITGMRLRGIGRASATRHLKKIRKSFIRYMARNKKQAREEAQFEKANREYLL